MLNPLNWLGEFIGFFTHPAIFWGWIFTSLASGSVWWVSAGPLSWRQVLALLAAMVLVAILAALALLSSDRYGTYTLAYLLLAVAITCLAWSYHYSTEAAKNDWWSSALLEVGAAMLLGSVLDVVIICARSNDRLPGDDRFNDPNRSSSDDLPSNPNQGSGDPG